MILAADVGGTKTALGLFEAEGDRPRLRRKGRLPTWDHDSLAGLTRAFLEECDRGERERIGAACFGVAAVVTDGRAEPMNLPWTVHARELESGLELSRVILINDLVAAAHGIGLLGEEDLHVLEAGVPDPHGNVLVVAAGTGFGAAVVVRAGAARPTPPGAERVVSTEAGHVDFAPRTDEEVGLMRFARELYGHVSVERIVSGPGIALIHEYLRESAATAAAGSVPPESPEVQAEIESSEEPQVAITRAALEGRSRLCARVLDLFVAAFGAAAGNLALATFASGGVYVGGGIAPRIRVKLDDGTFVAAFRDKGRVTGLQSRIPLKVVVDPDVALLGAAAHALQAC